MKKLLVLLVMAIAHLKPIFGTSKNQSSLSWTNKVNDALRELEDIWDQDNVERASSHNTKIECDDEVVLDESLYSRQLFVYGKSAQRKLLNAHAVIIGNDLLADEIGKNLALAGVGKITLIKERNSNPSTDNIRGKGVSLEKYIHELNHHVDVAVAELKDSTASFESISPQLLSADIIIGTNMHIDRLIDLNLFTRLHDIKLSIGTTIGACGFVFNDFLQHNIIDIDGESYKEIPLKSDHQLLNGTQLIISIVEEETLNYGTGDKVVILSSINPDHVYPGQVVQIISAKSCMIQFTEERFDMGGYVEGCRELIISGKANIRKLKQSFSIAHNPLIRELFNTTINPSNTCASRKSDLAYRTALYHMIRVYYMLQRNSAIDETAKYNLDFFKALTLEQLKIGGFAEPLKEIKDGGKIGESILDVLIPGFISSLKYTNGSSSPGVVSVIGAMLAQEVIKGITCMYAPVSQWQLFESFSSLSLLQSGDDQDMSVTAQEIHEELKTLKVFVVGAGAIGCEVLKHFALLDVGSANRSDSTSNATHDSLWERTNLTQGGIIVADMDLIEKSNLNRQLLFREKHIGQSKSLIASSQVIKINPRMNVYGITARVGEETEGIFNEVFWKDTDVVITGLDNIDARKFVDAKCKDHKKFLIDSGTLGTKGNTQVIIPFLTETYSDSSDPVDESIPLCTLKSFPYLPEHCVAWAKNQFDTFLKQDIRSLQLFFDLVSKRDGNRLRLIEDLLADLTKEDTRNLEDALAAILGRHDNLRLFDNFLIWSLKSFQRIFFDDIVALLNEHPPDEVDLEGVRFWGGSKKIPVPQKFDHNNQDHILFIELLATLRWNAIFPENSISVNMDSKNSIFNASLLRDWQKQAKSYEDKTSMLFDFASNVSRSYTLTAIDFEKDDLSLGHVQFVMTATNIRSTIYSINPVDVLEVQRIAGNIIPAIATTTSMVAGLVSLELMKIAAERVLLRKVLNSFDGVLRDAKDNLDEDDDEEDDSESNQQHRISIPKIKSILGKVRKIFPSQWLRDFNENESLGTNESDDSNDDFDAIVHDIQSDKNANLRTYLLVNRDRILARFRNSFVNLAQPSALLAYCQPMQAKEYRISKYLFTTWDEIKVPFGDISVWTIQMLKTYLQSTYKVQLQSLSIGSSVLYAEFLSSGNDDLLTVKELFHRNHPEHLYSLEMKNCSNVKLNVDCIDSNNAAVMEFPPLLIPLKTKYSDHITNTILQDIRRKFFDVRQNINAELKQAIGVDIRKDLSSRGEAIKHCSEYDDEYSEDCEDEDDEDNDNGNEQFNTDEITCDQGVTRSKSLFERARSLIPSHWFSAEEGENDESDRQLPTKSINMELTSPSDKSIIMDKISSAHMVRQGDSKTIQIKGLSTVAGHHEFSSQPSDLEVPNKIPKTDSIRDSAISKHPPAIAEFGSKEIFKKTSLKRFSTTKLKSSCVGISNKVVKTKLQPVMRKHPSDSVEDLLPSETYDYKRQGTNLKQTDENLEKNNVVDVRNRSTRRMTPGFKKPPANISPKSQ